MSKPGTHTYEQMMRRMVRTTTELHRYAVPRSQVKRVPSVLRAEAYDKIVVPAVQRYHRWLRREIARRARKG